MRSLWFTSFWLHICAPTCSVLILTIQRQQEGGSPYMSLGFILLMADFPATVAYYGVWLGVSLQTVRMMIHDFKYLFTHFTAQRRQEREKVGLFSGVGGWMAQGRRGPPLLSGGIWGCPGWSPAPDEKHPTVFFGPRPHASSTLPATACQTQRLAKIDQSPARKEVVCHEVHMVQVRGAEASGIRVHWFQHLWCHSLGKAGNSSNRCCTSKTFCWSQAPHPHTNKENFSQVLFTPTIPILHHIGFHLGQIKAERSALGPN